MRSFKSLTEPEVLALAIFQEEEDGKIYDNFAQALRPSYPDTAKIFECMREEENVHRHRLTEMYKAKFGDAIPLIRRQDVKGFIGRRPVWLVRPLGLEIVRKEAASMEAEAERFYRSAAKKSSDLAVRQLFLELAEVERGHEHTANSLSASIPDDAKAREAETSRRLFVLQIIQPGLAGLMDGSVSTLAPLFAAAFATRNSHDAFLVGLAASVGAGISMGFAEALSDDGSLTGRGHPWMRGVVCGFMTMLGGIGHTLPYLIPSFSIATSLAIVVVLAELFVISWVRHRYMDTPFVGAALQVVVGGLLVFIAGIVIGIS